MEAAFDAGLMPPNASMFEAVPGNGVIATVDGKDVIVGSPRFLAQNGIELSSFKHRIETLQNLGRTVIAVAGDGLFLGIIALGDLPRPEAGTTITRLRDAGVRTVLITGDNERAGHRIAKELGLDEVHAEVLPGEKAELIRNLQQQGRTAMVGDGINDAPALMQADVGIAMGSGTDIAIDAADIIILNNDISNVVVAQEISQQDIARCCRMCRLPSYSTVSASQSQRQACCILSGRWSPWLQA